MINLGLAFVPNKKVIDIPRIAVDAYGFG